MARWGQALRAGLLRGEILPETLAYLVRIAVYMDPAPPDPANARYEIRQVGAVRSYFVNGHRMLHGDLLRRRFRLAHEMPMVTHQWLRRHRRQVDEMLSAGCSPEALKRVVEIYARIEEIYAAREIPLRELYEAYNLGRVVQILEDDRNGK